MPLQQAIYQPIVKILFYNLIKKKYQNFQSRIFTH